MASSSSSSPLILPLSPKYQIPLLLLHRPQLPNPILPHRLHIIPCFTFLRTLLPAEGDIVCFFSRSPYSLNASLSTSILPILSVLREHDLPEARISKLLKIQPGILMLTPLRVNEIVEEVKAAGVPTSNPIFVYAFRTVAGLKRANWDRKMAVFESFGLSEADIMKMSVEKIRYGEASSFFSVG